MIRSLTASLWILSAMLAACVVLNAAGSEAASSPAVSTCRPFVLSTNRDGAGVHRFRVWDIKRSARLRCSMARKLIRSTYGNGPLKVIRTVYEPGGSGRPIYWLKKGWRCGNGAGGAACWNEEQPVFDVIEGYGVPMAVAAATG